MKARKIADLLDYEIYLSFDDITEYKIPKNKIYKQYNYGNFYLDSDRLIPHVVDITLIKNI